MKVVKAKFIRLSGEIIDGDIADCADYAIRDGVVFDRLHGNEPILLVERGSDEGPPASINLYFVGNSLQEATEEEKEGSIMGTSSGIHHHSTWVHMYLLHDN